MNTTPARGATIQVIVADRVRARCFDAPVATAPLVEREVLYNPSERLHEAELTSDRAGRLTSSTRHGGHSLGTQESPHEHGAEMFAQQICAVLDAERTAGRLARLYLIAEPGFLGVLRKHLGTDTGRLVAGEVAKDLVTCGADEIRAQLPRQL